MQSIVACWLAVASQPALSAYRPTRVVDNLVAAAIAATVALSFFVVDWALRRRSKRRYAAIFHRVAVRVPDAARDRRRGRHLRGWI
jgi:hypothetical protein